MAVFYNNSITDEGRKLWGDIQAGATFRATKIVIGSGQLPTGKSVRTMTAVAVPVAEMTLNKLEPLSNGDFIFGTVFSNAQIDTAFYFRELALFAKCIYSDGTETAETLYAYGNAGDDAELIPAYSSGSAVERQLDLLSYIGNDATVKIEVGTGVYITRTEYDDKVGELEKGIEDASVMTDTATGGKYRWGVENGLVYVQEVTE